MVDFEDENGTDGADVHKQKITLKFDPEDIVFWFGQLEDEMTWAGAKSQWTKRQILNQNLPPEVRAEVKTELRKTQTQAGVTAYKTIKVKLIKIFGPKQGEAYMKAAKLVNTGKPSQLAKKLVDLLCNCSPPLANNCCMAKVIAGMWKLQMPEQVRTAVANKELTAENFEEYMDIADAVHNTLTASQATVAEARLLQQGDPQLAAYQQKGKGKGNKNNQQGGGAAKGASGTNNATSSTKTNRGKRADDNPPEGCCPQHWRRGRKAWYCMDLSSCPWKDFITPRPKN